MREWVWVCVWLVWIAPWRGDRDQHHSNPPPPLPFSTDKVAQAATTPYAEACWYFRETRDQFRLGGTLTIVDGGNTDGAAAWARLSPSAREWNAGPAPGVVKGKVVVEATTTTSAPAAEVGGGGGGGGDAATPHAHFRLVLLDIDSVDHVALESDRRWRHSLAGEEWETVEVNP